MAKNAPTFLQYVIAFAVGIGIGLIGIGLYTTIGGGEKTAERTGASRAPSAVSNQPDQEAWTVGQLRPNGLRIMPSGRSDGSAVLDPSRFEQPDVRRAYAIAREIPEMINKLYCWCKCENRGVHRSNLACFEDEMAVTCDVCRETAEIAYRMMQNGETDPGTIQRVVDREWGPRRMNRPQ